MLAIHAVLEIFPGRRCDALLRFCQQVGPFAKDDGSRWTYGRNSRLLVVLQTVIAKLALDDLRIPTTPFEFGHIERTTDLTITTPDAQCAVPGDRTPLALLQSAEGTARHARRIEAV